MNVTRTVDLDTLTDWSTEKRRPTRKYPPEHLSASSVDLLQDCAKLWEARYRHNREGPRGGALILGSAFDLAVEWAWRHKWHSGWFTGEQLAVRYAASFVQEEEKGPVIWDTRGRDGTFEDGLNLCTSPLVLGALRSFTLAPHPDNPKEPGLQVRVELHAPGVPVPIIGFIDALGTRANQTVVADLKTARRAWDRNRHQKELQARVYLAALWQSGQPFSSLTSEYIVCIPGPTPEACRLQRVTPKLTERDVLVTLEALRRAWKQIESGAFPNNPHSYRCNDSCPCWEECFGPSV